MTVRGGYPCGDQPGTAAGPTVHEVHQVHPAKGRLSIFPASFRPQGTLLLAMDVGFDLGLCRAACGAWLESCDHLRVHEFSSSSASLSFSLLSSLLLQPTIPACQLLVLLTLTSPPPPPDTFAFAPLASIHHSTLQLADLLPLVRWARPLQPATFHPQLQFPHQPDGRPLASESDI